MSIDTAIALVSLAEAKAFLQITASTQDTIVGDLVNSCSEWVNNFVGHDLLEADYEEYYDGDGTEELILKNFPVTELTLLNDDPQRAFAAPTAKNISADVMLDSGAGIVRLWNNGGAFFRARGNVKVTYSAGYDIDAMPYDIRLAVKKLVAFLYRASYAQPKMGIQTETTGDRTTTYFNEEILKDVAGLLKPYRTLIGGGTRSFS